MATLFLSHVEFEFEKEEGGEMLWGGGLEVGCRDRLKEISKWRTGEMEKGDRELVNAYLPGFRLGESDGKKIRKRGKINRQSVTE